MLPYRPVYFFLFWKLTFRFPFDTSLATLITSFKSPPRFLAVINKSPTTINTSKIKLELGWTPKTSFEVGIQKTVEWYLANRLWWENILKKKYDLKRIGNDW